MKSPPIMYAYAAFVMLCGLIAFAMAGFGGHARTALLVASGMAALMVICAMMAQRLAANRTVGMIGIHAGLILPLLFALLLGFRSYVTFASGERRYLAIILAIMTVGSVLAFVAILLTRPKPEARI